MRAPGNFGTSRMQHGGLPDGSSGLGHPDSDLPPVAYLGALGGVCLLKEWPENKKVELLYFPSYNA